MCAWCGTCSALQRKDFAAAAAHFEEALAVNPLNPDAWFSQGYAYLKLGEQRKALRVGALAVAPVQLCLKCQHA